MTYTDIRYKQLDDFVKLKEEELTGFIDGEYFSLHRDRTCLDGYFTSEQLIKIAEAMKECEKKYLEIN